MPELPSAELDVGEHQVRTILGDGGDGFTMRASHVLHSMPMLLAISATSSAINGSSSMMRTLQAI